MINVQLLPTWGIWVSIIGTLATVVVAVMAITTLNRIINDRKRDKKERLLKIILDWILEIHQSSLKEKFPLTDISPEQSEIQMQANILLRYSIAFSKNEYILAIINPTFKNELSKDINALIEVFTGFLFLTARDFGIKDSKDDFTGKALEIVQDIEKKIQIKPKAESILLNKYFEDKAELCTLLFRKIGNMLSNL